MEQRKGRPIQMYSGKPFWPLDPRADEIDVNDLAWHLASIPRYGGAAKEFYSVAQHAVLVSMLVPQEHAWVALHHEDPEAWLGDLLGPNKNAFPDYLAAEQQGWEAVCERFDLGDAYARYGLPNEVTEIDVRIRVNERRDLLNPSTFSWGASFDALEPLDLEPLRRGLRPRPDLGVRGAGDWGVPGPCDGDRRPPARLFGLSREEAAKLWLWRFEVLSARKAEEEAPEKLR